jgi:hypothetical protein
MLGVRESVVRALRAELVGPSPGLPAVQFGADQESSSGEEILRPQDSPRLRYGAGILFPQRSTTESQNGVDAGSALDARETELAMADGDALLAQEGGPAPRVSGSRSEADTEQEVNRANEYLPSAIGLTVLARVPEQGLRIRVRGARYVKRELAGRGRVDKDGEYHPYNAWWRRPFDGEAILSRAELVDEGLPREVPIGTGTDSTRASVHVYSRPLGSGSPTTESHAENDRLITVTFLNRTESAGLRPTDEECLFQCRFVVEAIDNSACFLDYPKRDVSFDAPDESSLRLLYRHRRVFGVGHGCAPEWEAGAESAANEWASTSSDAAEAERARRVWTEAVPVFEIKPILPRELPGVNLSMQTLADPDSPASLDACRELLKRYRQWINKQRDTILNDDIPPGLTKTAGEHLDECDRCAMRIDDGIDLLSTDRRVRRAFALMNKAMLMQQAHYRLASTDVRGWVVQGNAIAPERPYIRPDYSHADAKWRPFQLAFILMNMRAFADATRVERRIVDVIWFPTGGGKTEAYLGLTAFTLFFRRLRNPANTGTTALMRYTLRLLTAQQYQRAASLICACEVIRRDDTDALGIAPFTIGLWVGSTVTPNKENDAVIALRRLGREGSGNPFVVLACPWCGAAMGPVKVGGAYRTPGYKLLAAPKRVRFVCEDGGCAFHDDRGLPLMVIDEQIYAEPPSLLIGTVDKFALLPWYPDAAALFGGDGAVSPPDLVIQDELHLISGPLGSMVGIYETLIDALCTTSAGIPAKIVASTATISRAVEQIDSLYARNAFLFPPQGLVAGDSFFAEERRDRPGRLYAGVFATGLPSQQTAMVRVMSALLQAPATVSPGADNASLDPYWTLIAYFNSIRELGSAATLVSADIREYLGVTYERLGLTSLWGAEAASRRRFLHARGSLELTSRVSGNAVTDALQQLFIPFEGIWRPTSGEGRRGEHRDPCVDVCLATNMIQVGLDVPRLGLMLVAGQPKMTSEYIQATSRVGRNTPGLVVVLYSPSKPRDRSHYEHFRAFHESIYRNVEPTSVTPFAIPVRERALHAVLVAFARIWGDAQLRERPGTGVPEALAERIHRTLMNRVSHVDSSESTETDEMIHRLLDEWRRLPPSRYGDFAPPDSTVPLMYPSGQLALPSWQDRARPTPSSLRNVDAECNARVLTEFPRS